MTKPGYRYPNAGQLQAALTTQLTGNPGPEHNPYEVHSEKGLEDSFARPEDAEYFADELRRSGVRGVDVKKRTRQQFTPPTQQRAAQNPPMSGYTAKGKKLFEQTLQKLIREGMDPFQARVRVSSAILELDRTGEETGLLTAQGRRDAHQFFSMMKKKNPDPNEETTDTEILCGMARAIWVMAWASWAQELTAAERKQHGVPRMSGADLDEIAPPTPDSAERAARDLYTLIERANGKTPGELFERACQVDGCDADAENADLFGHYLAMQSMGEGVSWFDDHKQFALKFPDRGFEAHYDDGEVWWSPQVHSRMNPGKYNFGNKQLGAYAPGAHVQLARHDTRTNTKQPGDWVTVVGNYADTTGVVVVKVDRNKATVEKDGRDPLFDVDSSRCERMVR